MPNPWEPDHWFPALKSISGEDPVPPEDRGKVRRMTKAWLAWGEKQSLENAIIKAASR